jgi:BlaI family penicillinase repressor
MPPSLSHSNLSRRERQIMDIIYQRGEVTAAAVMAALPEPPSYSAVRTMLRILEEKGILTHKRAGLKFVFTPVISREKARKSALKQLLATFFAGSVEQAVAALLDESSSGLSVEELKRLTQRIEQAKKEGK